ncbi:MAG: hypothetical protein U0R52_12085 [Solirubrobacterales bacterium]
MTRKEGPGKIGTQPGKEEPIRAIRLAGAVAAATVAIGVAVAEASSAPTTVTLTGGGPTGAHGKVTSPRAVCKAKRKVVLYMRLPQPQGKVRIGSDLTDGKGRWNVAHPLLKGDYFAKVSPRVVEVGNETVHCRFDVSLRVHL